MNFDLQNAIQILERTPHTLKSMLSGLSDDWIRATEGPETWSPYDVMGHLIHGEKTDWIARLNIVLSDSPKRKFEPFDRFAQFEESKGKTLDQLLAEFADLRRKNLDILRARKIGRSDYSRTAMHPALGEVTLGQLLSTWVVHDLDHLYQISRVMSLQYREEVGPWVEYLRILKPKQ
jgi:hypothetical protein